MSALIMSRSGEFGRKGLFLIDKGRVPCVGLRLLVWPILERSEWLEVARRYHGPVAAHIYTVTTLAESSHLSLFYLVLPAVYRNNITER